MRNIVIVDCISTGINYINDIIKRNFNPIVLELRTYGSPDRVESRRKTLLSEYASIDSEFEIIYEKDSYEETLEMVRKFDPLLVLPGNERGVETATRLADDLGLLGASAELLPYMTQKDQMQMALKKAGLRYIKGKVIHSVEEAVKFYDEEGLDEVVVKPVLSAGSFGVTICKNKDEMIDAITSNLGSISTYADKDLGLVVQEKINGTEYIVNTVSNNGVHRVTLIWKYYKVKTREGNQIYDFMESVNELDIAQAEMVEYAYDVADAIGIQYGPIHGEYMIDDKGPVLIEVNCRPCGGHMAAEFLDKISGQHETDSILDSYLDEERFNRERLKPYRLYGHGGLKFFIVPEDLMAESIPMQNIAERLPSHFKTSLPTLENGHQFFPKTIELDNAGGIIYLCHEDKAVVRKDLDYLRSVEQNAFSQIISSGEDKVHEKKDNATDIRKLLIDFGSKISGTALLVSEEDIEIDNIVHCDINRLDDVPNDFDTVIIDLDESLIGKDDYQISLLILDIINKVKVGGIIAIPQKTYQYIAGGRNGMEALVKALNLRIELPLYGVKNVIFASKS